MIRTSCCDDLRYHLGIKTIVEAGCLGVAFVTYVDQKRRLLPIYHCPWCAVELNPQGERPLGTTYTQ